MDIQLQIEDLIEKNGSDFEFSKLFKQYIKEYKGSLSKIFEKNQGKDFLVKHTKKLDSIISLMYKTILRRMFHNYLPMRNSIPIAIVALGSYGREQLCVHSDIDLLIVYEDVEGFNTQLIIEKLFYLALDAGLKLGHRVHNTDDLFNAADEDITIRSSLMESRFISGSIFTWHATQKELNKIRLYKQKEFLLAKLEEAHYRRKKFPVSMEPNIKENTGGLRDAQLLFWLANVIYGVNNLKDLSQILFTDNSYKEYRIAIELLYRVRSALHIITGKQEDTLRLEYIPSVSKMLGFKDQKKFSSKVIEANWQINNFTRIFAKKMMRPYLYDSSMISTLKKNRLSKGVYQFNDRIYVSYNEKMDSITQLLKILLSLEDKNHKFDSAFLSKFTYVEISHPLGTKIYSLLKQLLSRKNFYCYLELFYDAGMLSELFSNFKKVKHLPQFDGYHHHPVDMHSIKCVESLENIKDDFINSLHNEFSDEEKLLLKVVTLFHDTGKGRKQDHSEVGARLIAPFLKKLKLKEELIERGILLVKHHILMSNVAFKENIHNEKALYKFMSMIKDSKNLKLLYVLTYADINGVSDETYNGFNAKLLYDLYLSALEISQNSDRITDAKKRLNIEKRVKNLKDFKTLPKLFQKKILNIESNLFFFKHSPQNIIDVSTKAKETQEYDINISIKNTLTIEIYRRVPFNISYLLSALKRFNVGSMEIFTLFDDIKYFKIEFLETINEEELPEVKFIIDNAFNMDKNIELPNIKIHKDEVSIDCEHSLTHAEIKIHTANQKGLLSYVMSCFEALNINIITAKIHSTKYKVKDSFLMNKQNNICNNTHEIYKLLTNDN